MNNKYLSVFILFTISYLYSTAFAFAQNKTVIDSLEKQINHSSIHDTTKINLMVSLIRELYAFEPRKASQYAEIALPLSQKIDFKKGEVRVLYYTGMIAYYAGDNVKAMNCFLQSLKISELSNDAELIGANLSRIGDINREEGNYTQADEYINKAITILRKTSNKLFLITALFHRGLLHLYQENFIKSLESLEEALFISQTIKDNRYIAISLYYIGEVYLKQKDYERAFNYYRQSITFNEKINNRLLLAGTLNNVGKLFLSTQQLDSAIIYSRNALNLARTINQKSEIADAYAILYKSHYAKKQIDSAFYYQSRWIVENDSLFNEKKNKQIFLLQYNAQKEKDKIEIEKQKAEIAKRDTLLYASIAIICFILLIIIILYINNRNKTVANLKMQKQKAEIEEKNQAIIMQNEELRQHQEELKLINENLEEKKQEIELLNDNLESVVTQRTQELKQTMDNLTKQNQDLQQFSYIISHNLRAPVARVLGLVNLFNEEDYSYHFNKEIMSHLKKTTNDLDTVIGDLTQIISIRNDLSKIKEKIDIIQLVTQEQFLLRDEIEKSKALIDTKGIKENTLFSIKSYVQSIIHNLLSNAIKYKSPHREPIIRISTTIEKDFICMSFKDNGIGMNLNNIDKYKIFGLYKRIHDHVEGKGMGLFLVKTQIESLGGKIEVESQLDVGTIFKVYFPK
ncbi:MAG: tetratricopeptide repeat-containing sensor histidine kinase [Thermoflexibacter sp.]|nr:tetratricopeptide repeat-containing sensor histidine kinase [Thermoflexibacter sp.]